MSVPLEKAAAVELDWLRAWAVSKSGLTPEIRQTAWPLLCQVSPESDDGGRQLREAAEAVPHTEIPYAHQISLDVPRAFPTMDHWTKDQRQLMQARLTAVLQDAMVACRSAGLECHYYQGLHAIAVVLLCQLGQHRATLCLIRLLHGPLRGFADASMELTTALLGCLMPLLQQEDAAVYEALLGAGIQEFFALPWVITWFAHCEHNVARVAPVFDFCMGSSNPAAPIYLSAALVLAQRQRITQATDEADMHGVIRHLHEDVHWPHIVSHASAMYQRLPPAQLVLLSNETQQAVIAAQWPEVAHSPPVWHASTLSYSQLPSTAAAVSAGHACAGFRSESGVSDEPPSPSRKVLRAWKSGDKLRRGWGSRCDEDEPVSPTALRDSPVSSNGAAQHADVRRKPSKWDALLFLEEQQSSGRFTGCFARCRHPNQYAIVAASLPAGGSSTAPSAPYAATCMLAELVQPVVHQQSCAAVCARHICGCLGHAPVLALLLLMFVAAAVFSGALLISAVDGIAPDSLLELRQHFEL